MLTSQWHRISLGILLVICFGFESSVVASPPRRASRGHYPRVYSPTGSLYGPTQAHYQWNRQYGRPWHGYRGINYPSYYGSSYGSFPQPSLHQQYYSPYYYRTPFLGLGYSSFGFGSSGFGSSIYVGPTFSGHYGYPTYPAYGFYSVPSLGTASPLSPSAVNQVLEERRKQQELQRLQDADALRQARTNRPARPPAVVEFHKPEKTPRTFKPSTDSEKLESFRLETHGNVAFKKGQFVNAYLLYKQSAKAADDRAEPHLRMALSFAALSQFSRAIDELKDAIARSPQVALPEETLNDVFGDANEVVKSQMMQRATDWVNEDLKSAGRLLLLGALLHFDGRVKQSNVFLEKARVLAPQDDLLARFATSEEVESNRLALPPVPPPPTLSAPTALKPADGPRFPSGPLTNRD